MKEEIKDLKKLREEHLKLGREMIEAYDGSLYPVDLFAVSVLNRSICLLKGFSELIQSKNFVAAAPLVRLQLDNLLRFSATWIVKEPHKFAMKIFEGKQINRMKDQDGEQMHDSYLVGKLENDFQWIRSVYENTSGYVHLSEKHFFNSINGEKGNSIQFKISDQDEYLYDQIYEEAIEAFKAITEAIFHYVYSWTYTKDNQNHISDQKEE